MLPFPLFTSTLKNGICDSFFTDSITVFRFNSVFSDSVATEGQAVKVSPSPVSLAWAHMQSKTLFVDALPVQALNAACISL
jgi:hypothetical protein